MKLPSTHILLVAFTFFIFPDVTAVGKTERKREKSKTARVAPGQVSGLVVFKGVPPKRSPLSRESEPSCAKTEALSEEVIVAANRGLKDVHVRVKVVGKKAKASAEKKVNIYQNDCTYRPRVLGIVDGQNLVIHNKDGFTHNVHARIDGETWFNRGQPKGLPPLIQKDYGEAGQVLELGCDIHPWMKAFVVISDHPHFSVTNKNGEFKIDGLAPNQTVTVEAWHPKLGMKSKEVKTGSTLSIEFP